MTMERSKILKSDFCHQIDWSFHPCISASLGQDQPQEQVMGTHHYFQLEALWHLNLANMLAFLMGKSSINGQLSMAMFNNQRVAHFDTPLLSQPWPWRLPESRPKVPWIAAWRRSCWRSRWGPDVCPSCQNPWDSCYMIMMLSIVE